MHMYSKRAMFNVSDIHYSVLLIVRSLVNNIQLSCFVLEINNKHADFVVVFPNDKQKQNQFSG